MNNQDTANKFTDRPWRAGEAVSEPGRWGSRALWLVLAIGLVTRLILVWSVRDVGLNIADEQHYATIATNLVHGDGFSREPGWPTSIRPPLFPFMVATIWRLAGAGDVTAVRLAQIPLSLLTAWTGYLIGRRLYNDRVGLLAAIGITFYPSLLFSGVLVLSETLFTCLLMLALLACLLVIDRRSPWTALVAGAGVGAAALTRSIMWPSIAVLVGAVLVGLPGSFRSRVRIVAALVLGYAIVVGPWSLRNTLLQRSFVVVDTMGGLNLMMGNYAHTPEDRMWDAVSLTGEKAWDHLLPPLAPDGSRWTEGTKDKWAQRQAFSYIMAHPATALRRTLLKLADFWGIERDFVAGVEHGLYRPPAWIWVPIGIAIGVLYVALMVLGVLGLCMSRHANWRAHLLMIGLIVFMSAIYALAFGHPRYHLPLVPILAIYAAVAIDRRAWTAGWRSIGGVSAIVLVAALAAIWARDVFFRDAAKLAALGKFLGLDP